MLTSMLSFLIPLTGKVWNILPLSVLCPPSNDLNVVRREISVQLSNSKLSHFSPLSDLLQIALSGGVSCSFCYALELPLLFINIDI